MELSPALGGARGDEAEVQRLWAEYEALSIQASKAWWKWREASIAYKKANPGPAIPKAASPA